ncbi:hypothetical protein [Nocardia brasiliensis]|uniref:hypothetical protein n=1 Tax=Nocardia brasiliensis TaxID=37326 RepID=UPI00189471E2|nr:hypothetical protein [Nocardia brasiliensis]MBF6128451.1 hypothetical protein [Nocardia brasiliensis]
MGLFVSALDGIGLIYQLDSYNGDEHVVTPDEMERAAVLLKRTGDVDDDEWEEREEASRTRDAIIDEWRSAAQSQRTSLETIAAFPWLADCLIDSAQVEMIKQDPNVCGVAYGSGFDHPVVPSGRVTGAITTWDGARYAWARDRRSWRKGRSITGGSWLECAELDLLMRPIAGIR